MCKHNQMGYCKHGLRCRKRHENELCPMNQTCNDKLCELRHPKRCKFFDMNSKCKFENCAYAHIKDDKEIKIESLEKKCDKLELDITNLNNSKDLLGKGIMRLKREVEDVTVLCNSMKSNIEMLINEKKVDEQRTSPEIVNKNKKVKVKYKVLKTKSAKVIKKFKETNKEESFMDKHMEINPSLPFKCSNCCELFEKKSCLNSHMVKQHENKQLFKCDKCDFKSISRTSVEKHTHTKHKVCHTENTEKRDMYNESSEKDHNLKCKLCHEKFANNEETKTHYVKEHMKEINVSTTVNECDHIYCMDIEEDKCSKYCYYYKHLIEF